MDVPVRVPSPKRIPILCLLSIIIHLLSIFLGLLIFSKSCDYEGEINLNNTSCTLSENIGRRLFLHICSKDSLPVYDIRYFWRDEPGYLKPEVIGVQLTESEFRRVCAQC